MIDVDYVLNFFFSQFCCVLYLFEISLLSLLLCRFYLCGSLDVDQDDLSADGWIAQNSDKQTDRNKQVDIQKFDDIQI